MKKFNFKSLKSIRLSIYFAVLLSIIIIVTTSLFALYTVFNIKNLASSYESDIYKLRYSLSTILVQSLILDTKRNNFETTKSIIDLLKKDNLLSYTYVKDNQNGKIVLGDYQENSTSETYKADTTQSIQKLSKTVGNYTIYFGIPAKNHMDIYYEGFFDMITNILTLFIIFGIAVSVIMSGIISKPLERLSRAAKEITDGNFDVQIPKTNFSEINDLINSYNEMGLQLMNYIHLSN